MPDNFTGLPSLQEWLLTQGFCIAVNNLKSPMNTCNWYAYRKIKDYDIRPCETNDRKVSLVIWPCQYVVRGAESESCETEITGEVGGRWYKLQQYSTQPKDLQAQLSEIEKSLVDAWNALKGWLP